MPAARPTLAHLDALTGVRALAALWVFAYHAWLASGAAPVVLPFFAWRADVTPWFAFGWLGLDIFFVLSGFLLTRQEWIRLERSGSADEVRRIAPFVAFCATFLRKRVLRVYPAYYGCLTVLLALAATHAYMRVPGRLDLLLHLGMMHNAVDAYVSTLNGVFWTLPFEWQFYLLFPLLFVLLARAGPWTLGIAGVAIVFAAKGYVMQTGDGTMHAQLPIRLDAFVLGMCAGRLAARSPLPRRAAMAAFVAGLLALLVTPLLFFDLPTGNHYYSLKGFVRPLWIAAGVALMLLGITGERHPGVAIFGNRVAVGLGLISYSIYLFHVPVLEIFIQQRAKVDALAALPFGLPLVVGGALPLVLAVSYVSYKLVEQPFQRRRAADRRQGSARGRLLDRVDPLLVLLAWAMLLLVAREFLRGGA